MTLDETLLQKLSEWRPSAGQRSILGVADEGNGWTASLTADRSDELGCLAREFTVRPTQTPALENLDAWSERVAARVTGLLEPLAVHEVDATRGEALVRSHPPGQRGDQVFYYEMLLQKTGACTVRRYQADAKTHGKRQQVAFALTHEALAKLARDLVAAV
jgi:hypothetical protein